jgi:hypothetical protein
VLLDGENGGDACYGNTQLRRSPPSITCKPVRPTPAVMRTHRTRRTWWRETLLGCSTSRMISVGRLRQWAIQLRQSARPATSTHFIGPSGCVRTENTEAECANILLENVLARRRPSSVLVKPLISGRIPVAVSTMTSFLLWNNGRENSCAIRQTHNKNELLI